ncbi:MAG: hypothetical protein IT361_18185 [Gemmatimonadaceae bacterium]|nr:hypothetical protein [Gemmatimonadaceae bacterium]
MKQALTFALVSVVLIGLAASVMLLLYGGPEARRGVLVAAVLALLVQGAAYAVVRGMGRRNVIAGWGVGALLRFAVLVVFALVIVQRFSLPSAPATISLALFLFVTTLVEPLFLKS